MRSAPLARASFRVFTIVVRGAVGELLELDERGLRPGHHGPGHRPDGDVGAGDRDRAFQAVGPVTERHLTVRSGLAADPAGYLVDDAPGRRLPSTATMTSSANEAGLLGGAVLEDADDRAAGRVIGRVDTDADPDVRTGQRVVALPRAPRAS